MAVREATSVGLLEGTIFCHEQLFMIKWCLIGEIDRTSRDLVISESILSKFSISAHCFFASSFEGRGKLKLALSDIIMLMQLARSSKWVLFLWWWCNRCLLSGSGIFQFEVALWFLRASSARKVRSLEYSHSSSCNWFF